MKNILVIGASSDVGLTYLAHLAKKNEHIRVFAHYNSKDEEILAKVQEAPTINVSTFRADLTKEGAAQELVAAMHAEDFLPDAFLYLPAPPFAYRRVREYEAGCLDAAFAVGAESFLTLAGAFLPPMKKQGGNVLVMLTSYVCDPMPPKFMLDYLVGKYALMGAMKAAAAEYGSDRLHINGLAPEMMDTRFLQGIDPHIKEMNIAAAPAGRLLRPADLLPDMDRLLSEQCTINGECVRVSLS